MWMPVVFAAKDTARVVRHLHSEVGHLDICAAWSRMLGLFTLSDVISGLGCLDPLA